MTMALKYGSIGGGILSVITLIPFIIAGKKIDYSWGEIIGYTSMLLSLLAIYFGTKAYRDKYFNGKIQFIRAFGIGIYIAVIASLLFGIFSYILYAYVDPGFLRDYSEYTIEQMKNSGGSTKEINNKIAEYRSMESFWLNPFLQAFVMFGTVFAIGFVISLISAVVLKTKPAELTNQIKPV